MNAKLKEWLKPEFTLRDVLMLPVAVVGSLVYVALLVGVPLGLLYIAYHFITKYW